MMKRFFFVLAFLVYFWVGVGSNSIWASDYDVYKVPNAFDPRSVPAHTIHELSLLVLAICAVIFLIVTAILVFVIVRYRQRTPEDTQEPPQIYGSSQIELAWTVIPILITIVLILATARTIGDIQDKKLPEDALVVKIVGHQWWWEVRYPQHGFVTANEIHVPVSSSSHRLPTRIVLESADVLHSFWVPQLAGKMQLVPNKTNLMWIEPLHTGVFLGNCAQYCGTQHAFMLLRVIVHTPEEFQRWLADQKNPAESLASAVTTPPLSGNVSPSGNITAQQQETEAVPRVVVNGIAQQAAGETQQTVNETKPTTSRVPPALDEIQQAALASQGQKTFAAVACVNCHRIDGTPAQGVFGPDLTHLMSRQTIGAGVATNTRQNLWQWVRNPQVLKIGCYMPDMQLTNRQIEEIVAYLETLK